MLVAAIKKQENMHAGLQGIKFSFVYLLKNTEKMCQMLAVRGRDWKLTAILFHILFGRTVMNSVDVLVANVCWWEQGSNYCSISDVI